MSLVLSSLGGNPGSRSVGDSPESTALPNHSAGPAPVDNFLILKATLGLAAAGFVAMALFRSGKLITGNGMRYLRIDATNAKAVLFYTNPKVVISEKQGVRTLSNVSLEHHFNLTPSELGSTHQLIRDAMVTLEGGRSKLGYIEYAAARYEYRMILAHLEQLAREGFDGLRLA